MVPFVHLHVHSQFSILDGQASVSALVKKAIGDGMPGIALTDHGVMFGIKTFFDECNKVNSKHRSRISALKKEIKELQKKESLTPEDKEQIEKLEQEVSEVERQMFKPIFGCEAYCARRTRFDKDKDVPDPYNPSRSIDRSGWHLILLAKNKQGYLNLCKMVSASFTEGEYYRPRIDKDLLEQYHEGVIVMSACLGGEVPQHILGGHPERAEETVRWFKNIFGEDYYLEVQLHQTDDPNANRETFVQQLAVNEVIYDIAERTGVKVVATNDVHFVNQEDATAHDMLICLGTKRDLDDPQRMRYSQQEWLKTQEEMNAVFADRPELLSNTLEILNKVEFYSIENPALMPDFPLPEGFDDADKYLQYLTYEGAKRRYGDPIPEEVKERIDFELNTIKSMGFPGYFLIVQDLIQAARDMGVCVGPGRGSAAGSAVAYCLKITNLDPLKYGLLFERFLNPDRISLPDIDIDFDDSGRAKILQWATEKYGHKNVAQIITFGEMKAKSSIADVARLKHIPVEESRRITKLIPDKFSDSDMELIHKTPGYENAKGNVTIELSTLVVPELKKLQVGSNTQIQDTFKYAQKLEGSIRNIGVHACGVIIGKYDISDVIPISTSFDENGEKVLITQYEGKVIESTGLIKMDFLGLKTLSIIREGLENVKHRFHKDIDIDHIPLDDEKTFKLFCEGRMVGIFQFESAGMQKYLRELQPDRFELLIAMNALYRPGPMKYIPQYIARRHGREEIIYDVPETKEILEETFGVTVYQEQVMLLSRSLANFTRGQSDSLRKAMGKKKIEEMEKLKADFLKGGVENGHSKEVLEKIWMDWEDFAKYAFNKSHAACYSWLAYQTAYLKAHYPSEFMAGNLSCNLSNAPEIAKLMKECKAMGIRLLSPDVNESMQKFSVNSNGDIRFGLSGIKGVNQTTIDKLIEDREQNGPFTSIYDFVARIPRQFINRKTMEAFALSGAFDSFGIERESFFAPPVNSREDSFIATLLAYGRIVQEESSSQSMGLFGESEELSIPEPEVPQAEPWNNLTKLSKEYELVGIYISSNPLEPYRLILDKLCTVKLDDLDKKDLEEFKDTRMVFAGLVTNVMEGLTKTNKPYGRFTLEDLSGSHEFALFGKQYLEYKHFLKTEIFLICHASVKPWQFKKPDEPERFDLSFNSIELLTDEYYSSIKEVELFIPYKEIDELFVKEFITEINAHGSEKANDAQTKLIISFCDEFGNPIERYLMTERAFTLGTWLVDLLESFEIPYSVK